MKPTSNHTKALVATARTMQPTERKHRTSLITSAIRPRRPSVRSEGATSASLKQASRLVALCSCVFTKSSKSRLVNKSITDTGKRTCDHIWAHVSPGEEWKEEVVSQDKEGVLHGTEREPEQQAEGWPHCSKNNKS